MIHAIYECRQERANGPIFCKGAQSQTSRMAKDKKRARGWLKEFSHQPDLLQCESHFKPALVHYTGSLVIQAVSKVRTLYVQEIRKDSAKIASALFM